MKDTLKDLIIDLPNKTEEQLIHIYQSASSRKNKIYDPLLKAIDKERRKRGTLRTSLPSPATIKGESHEHRNRDKS